LGGGAYRGWSLKFEAIFSAAFRVLREERGLVGSLDEGKKLSIKGREGPSGFFG
jgi:hypothetical protein